jgi:hypothetical protein
MQKWNGKFWADLGERVGTTAIYGVIAMLTADASGVVSSDPKAWWVVVGLPTALSALKGLAANMAQDGTSASVVGVTSNTSNVPG